MKRLSILCLLCLIFIVSLPLKAQETAQYIRDIGWNMDGSLLATADSNGHVEVWDVSSNEIVFVNDEFPDVHFVVWSPTRNWLAIAGYDLLIVDVSSGQTIMRLLQGVGSDLDWSPDGNYLAITTADGAGSSATYYVIIWELQSQIRTVYNIYGANQAAWSSDSKQLAITRVESSESPDQLIILDIFTGQIATRFHDETANDLIAWSPDGYWIATSKYQESLGWYVITVWDVNTGAVVWSAKAESDIFEIMWSSDSQWLATATYSGVFFWDTSTGQLSSDHAPIKGHYIDNLALHPNGLQLAYISYANNRPNFHFAILTDRHLAP